ncbi:MAG TPA: delta-60 repeat domain-containing protein [Verrucomicrobiae bacterium]|nr:delta-60 repeat domain-containing protein [Verrucomicrobiae bacterium]
MRTLTIDFLGRRSLLPPRLAFAPILLLAWCGGGAGGLAAQPGTLDTNFAPVITGYPFVNLNTMLLQTNDRVLFGGSFTNVSGFSRNGIARLNPDGSVDAGFDPGKGISGGFGSVNAIAVQPADGKVLIGGSFTSVNGTNRTGVARLNADGSLDLSFNPGTGADGTVKTIVVQPDGSILLGGSFSTVHGKSRGRVARLDTSGNLDTNFVSGMGADAEVDCLALQRDGSVIIGGRFTHFNGASQPRIARLNGTNGAVDVSYNVGVGASDVVNALLLQPDGKVLAGGGFTNINSANLFAIARLQTNGVVDPSFATSVDYLAYTSVFALAQQSNGKVFIGGSFTSIGGVGQPSFARLNADGTLDKGFVPDLPNNGVLAVGLQSSGDVILAGPFIITDAHGNMQGYVARLHGDVASAPPAHPLLSNLQPLPGAIRFTVNGEAGRSYIIQTTRDFATWAPLATQMQATASQVFSDNSVGGVDRRFYRALVAP